MRIVAGSLKRRQLDAPTWDGLRPTSDKLRETLFNVLANRVEGARVLDGFAGTGALGIEAFSRGASHVTFIERDPRAQKLVERNLSQCGITDGYAMIRSSFARALETLRADRALAPYDLVLLDPPYDQQPDEVLANVHNIMTDEGLVVLEHARRQPAPTTTAGLVRVRQMKSGDSMLSFYSKF